MEVDISSPEIAAFAERAKLAGSATAKVLLREFVVKATAIYKASIDAKVPIKTGNLRSSLHGVTSGLNGVVSTSSKYGLYVEKGTPAHTILPNAKQALYWVGASSPVRSVQHPGTKATHFFENGIYEATPLVGALSFELLGKLTEVMK